MTKRTFNCPKCNKVLKDGDGERCGECEGKLCHNSACIMYSIKQSNRCIFWDNGQDVSKLCYKLQGDQP